MTKIDDIYALIEDMRQHFAWDQSDTKAFIVQALVEEAQELFHAFETGVDQEVTDELADVLSYAFTLAKMYEVEIYDIIKHKMEIVKARDYE